MDNISTATRPSLGRVDSGMPGAGKQSRTAPLIIIDNGHGEETAGKRSPDGRLQEWKWNREVARMLAVRLAAEGYDAHLLVPGNGDMPLFLRATRVNSLCQNREALLVSIHVNAAGMGADWRQAQGWSAMVAPNASLASKRLAGCLAAEAERHGLQVRTPQPGQKYWVQNLAICRDTKCPAVLTENLFMDNRADCEWLLSYEGKRTIVDVHLAAIKAYINDLD